MTEPDERPTRGNDTVNEWLFPWMLLKFLARQYRKHRKSVNENLGLIIAFAACGFAGWSGYLQRESIRLDKRPYIKVQFDKLDINRYNDGSHKIDPFIKVTVLGTTPALNVHLKSRCLFTPTPMSGTPTSITGLDYSTNLISEFLFPGEEMSTNCEDAASLPSEMSGTSSKMTPESYRGIVRVQGYVIYEDIFGIKHSTPFCFIDATDNSLSQRSCALGDLTTLGEPVPKLT